MGSRSSAPEAPMSKVALTRPTLERAPAPISWARSVAVFGHESARFAGALATRLAALGTLVRLLRVELRHTHGHELGVSHLHVHPDALQSGLEEARASAAGALTVGVGVPFAAGVQADLTLWIRAGESLLTLGPVERALSREADLILEEPRLATAEALADHLHAWATPTRT